MLTGSILFGFHSETTNQSLFSIINNASLIKKVYVPKYLFPLSRALSCAVNLGFSFIALLIVMIVTGASFHPTLGLIWIPILFLMLFSSGLSLILSAYTVFFRDLGQIYGVVIMAWTYFTPIFYPIDIVPKSYQWLMQLNPMYHYINYFRMLVLEGTIPSLEQTMICLLMGIISFLLGLFIFYKKQDKFILYI
jgi:ABC-2 type transport system permease protein